MILAGILAFGVMLAVGFIVGCGIAELEIWMKERNKEHESSGNDHI
jgi:hypothetical protein